MHTIQFSYPQAVYLLLLTFPLLFFVWWLYRYRTKVADQWGDQRYRSQILHGRTFSSEVLYVVCIGLCWVFSCLTVMDPYVNQQLEDRAEQDLTVQDQLVGDVEEKEGQDVVARKRKGHHLLFVLDTSASMQVEDTPQKISRLAYAKEIIDQIVADIEGAQVGLYAFTSDLTPLVPLTYDQLFFRLLLRQVGINEGDVAGTDLAKVLEGVVKRVKKFSGGQKKTVVLLTDGGDTRLESLKGSARSDQLRAILSRLDSLEDHTVQLFTIGLGTKKGALIPDVLFEDQPVMSQLDEELLEALASKTGGQYFFSGSYTTPQLAKKIKDILEKEPLYNDEVLLPVLEGKISRTVLQQGIIKKKLLYYWPLLGAVLCLSAALLWGRKAVALCSIVLLLLANSATADINPAQWRSAATAVQAKDYSLAVSIYQKILTQELGVLEKASVQMNLSHVLLTQGKVDESIAILASVHLPAGAVKEMENTLHTRLALAYLQRAETTENVEEGIKDAEKAVVLLRSVIKREDEDQEVQEIFAFAKNLVFQLQQKKEALSQQSLGDVFLHFYQVFHSISVQADELLTYSSLPSEVKKEQAELLSDQLLEPIRRWEFTEKRLQEEKQAGSEIFLTDTALQSAKEAFLEARVLSARKFLGNARLQAGFLQRLFGEGVQDPVLWVLQERVNGQKALLPQFRQDYQNATVMAKSLVGALAEEEENQALFADLAASIGSQSQDPEYDVAYYQLIRQGLANELLTIHQSALLLKDEFLQKKEQKILQKHMQAAKRVAFLEWKEKNPEKFHRLEEIFSALLQDKKNYKGSEVVVQIEKALFLLDPLSFSRAKLERLEKHLKHMATLSSQAQQLNGQKLESEMLNFLQALSELPQEQELQEIFLNIAENVSAAHQSLEQIKKAERQNLFPFFIDHAAWRIQEAKKVLDSSSFAPAQVLEDAIDQEEGFTRSLHWLSTISSSEKNIVEEFQAARQQNVVDTIQTFSPPQEKDPEIAWEKVVEAVNEAEEQAGFVLQTLQQRVDNIALQKEYAQQAIQSLKKALELLQSKEKNSSQGAENHQGEGENTESDQQKLQDQDADYSENESFPSEESDEKQPFSPSQELIQAIQQMEHDDRELYQPSEGKVKKGYRPW